MTCLHNDENVIHTDCEYQEGHNFNCQQSCFNAEITAYTYRAKHGTDNDDYAAYTYDNFTFQLKNKMCKDKFRRQKLLHTRSVLKELIRPNATEM